MGVLCMWEYYVCGECYVCGSAMHVRVLCMWECYVGGECYVCWEGYVCGSVMYM